MTDIFDEKNNLQPPNILRDDPQLLAKVPDLVQIDRVEKDIKLAQKELAFELGQTAIDVAGIIDPTPISDSISAMMSLYKGDYVGAALSTVSIVPYIGDALGKPIKEAHNAQKIAQLERKIEGLVKQLKELAPERVEKAAENLTEAVAKGRVTLIEKIEKGHSLLRHGPQLTDNQLIKRLEEGVAPDGKIEIGKVPRGSTRFSSDTDWLQIREKASEQITKRAPFHGGVDLTKPPAPGSQEAFKGTSRIIEFDRPIGNGFIGKEETLHEITAQNGRKLKVFGEVEKVEDLTRVQVTYKWNGKQWEAKQFFPDATNYDPVTRQYTKEPDTNFIRTTLPPVVEKKASLDLGEKDAVAQQTPAVEENTSPTARFVGYSELAQAFGSPLSKTKIYTASQMSQSLVDNDPQLKSALTAAIGYEKLIRAQGNDNTQFQDYRYTASIDPQTNKLTVSDRERGTLVEAIPKVSISILQPLSEQDSQRFEMMRTQLKQGQTIAQSGPPNNAQLHVEKIAPLSASQLQELSPGELLRAANTVQQWQKSKPFVPVYGEKLLSDFRDLQTREATLKVEHEQNDKVYTKVIDRGDRGWLNPLGASAKAYDRAHEAYWETSNQLSYVQRKIWQTEGSVKEIQQKQAAQEQWSTHPFTQTAATLSEKLKSADLQPHVERVQAEARSLQRWEKAAVALGRPESYVGRIQEIQSAYGQGQGVTSENVEVLNRDLRQYQYQQQQQTMAQSQKAADGGFALE
jgi:hypothetical protein